MAKDSSSNGEEYRYNFKVDPSIGAGIDRYQQWLCEEHGAKPSTTFVLNSLLAAGLKAKGYSLDGQGSPKAAEGNG